MAKNGACSTKTPKYPGTPKGKQTSGKAKHDRMKMAKKVEHLKGLPTKH